MAANKTVGNGFMVENVGWLEKSAARSEDCAPPD
jgi:hypothetical protein